MTGPRPVRCLLASVAGLLLVFCGCGQPAQEAPPAPHEHADEAAVDLERPVEELFAARCEHGIPTHTCAECRYEVGVVAAPESLFAAGLLHRARVEVRPLGAPLQLTGEVQFDARRVTHVSAQTEGLLHAAHVALGDRVQRGQPLVEVDVVELGEAQAAALEARALHDLATRNLERLTSLRQEGIVAEKDYFAARQEWEASQIRTAAAFGKLTRLGMPPEEAQALTPAGATGRLVLRAPAAGQVLEMHAVPGEIAKPDLPLLTIGDHDAVWVWADLYERDVARVARAQAAQPLAALVSVQAYPGLGFPGTVDLLSPSLDAATRTVKLRVAVANPGRQLLAGMFARIELLMPEGGSALAVPASAVLEDEGRAFVFVHHDGPYYVRRLVQPGRAAGGWVEIEGGLAAGQTVVADGSFLLKSDVLRSKMGAGCAD